MLFWEKIVYPPKSVCEDKTRECFANKWVVVTGATSGIGEALTLRLIRAKANLYLIARNEQKLKELCSKARENGCEAFYDSIDLREREQLDALCTTLRDRFPAVSYFFCTRGNPSIGQSMTPSTGCMIMTAPWI